MSVSFGSSPDVKAARVEAKQAKKVAKQEKAASKVKTTNIKTTDAGNPYYKSNTGKRLGAIISTPTAIGTAVGTGMFARMSGLGKVGTAAVAVASAAVTIAGGTLMGGIRDGMVNRDSRKEADQMAKFNAEA